MTLKIFLLLIPAAYAIIILQTYLLYINKKGDYILMKALSISPFEFSHYLTLL